MKLTKQKIDAIHKVINDNRLISDRVNILKKRGYDVRHTPLRWGGAVGSLHSYTNSTRVQIGAHRGLYHYAWTVVFDPWSPIKVAEYNYKHIVRCHA